MCGIQRDAKKKYITSILIFKNDSIVLAICESGDSSGASTPGSEKEVVIPNTSASLTQHPVRHAVMDFLRVIVLDSLSMSVSAKAAPVSVVVIYSLSSHF